MPKSEPWHHEVLLHRPAALQKANIECQLDQWNLSRGQVLIIQLELDGNKLFIILEDFRKRLPNVKDFINTFQLF